MSALEHRILWLALRVNPSGTNEMVVFRNEFENPVGDISTRWDEQGNLIVKAEDPDA